LPGGGCFFIVAGMKRLFPLLLATCPSLAGPLSVNPAGPESGSAADIPLGVEVVTGYRSEYVHRGFELAQDLIDVQAEAEIALSDRWVLNLGGYYGTGSGSDDFSEAAAFLDLRYEAERWTAGIATTWRDYQDSFFKDGFDLAPRFAWHLTDDWNLAAGIAYDTGDGGWYGNLEAVWSKPLGESSFLGATAGTSWTEDYYGSSGWHDAYARLSWTYAFNDRVAVTPFAGTSIPTSGGPGSNRLFAGIWF
jgi:hypothetical protein